MISINTPEINSGTSAMADVEVALAPADAGAVACNASNGIVGIAVLPNGGRGAGPASPGGQRRTGGTQPGQGPGGGSTTGGTTKNQAPGGHSRSASPGHGTH